MNSDPTAVDIRLDPTQRRMVGRTNHGNLLIDVPIISEVADNLWQGGCIDGLILPKFIKHVVSLYPWERYKVQHELDSFLEIRMYDSLTQQFDQIYELAEWVNYRREDGPVLVHCQAGLNRSSLVAGMALVFYGMSGDEAVKYLREKRSPAVLCNPTFEKHLRQFKKVELF